MGVLHKLLAIGFNSLLSLQDPPKTRLQNTKHTGLHQTRAFLEKRFLFVSGVSGVFRVFSLCACWAKDYRDVFQ